MDPALVYKKSVAPFLELARPFNGLAMMLSYSVGYLFYSPEGYKNLWIGLIVTLLMHSAMTLQNDLHDMDVDAANKVSSILTSRSVPLATVRKVVMFLIAGALVVASLSNQKLILLAYICLSTLIGWMYNAKPVQLSRRPLVSIATLGLYYALLPSTFGFALGGHKLTGLFLVFLSVYTVLRCSISMLKDYKDVVGDKKHHKQTFLLEYGHHKVAIISVAAGLICYPLLNCLVFYGLPHSLAAKGIFIPLGLLVVVNCLNRLQLLKTTDNRRLGRIFQKAFIGENYFNLTLVLCLALR